jgi:leader peptidase (prepilin peptidase) / N-methyltransferase
MAALAGSRSALAAGAAGTLVGAAAGGALSQPFQIVASAVLAGLMGAIAAEDLRRFTVPDALNALAGLAGLVTVGLAARAAGLDPLQNLMLALLQMGLCGGALYLLREAFFRLRNVDGLGLGDVKLAGTAGIWLGWELFAVAVLLAATGALVFVASRRLLDGGWPREQRIPLALYLAPSIWAVWFFAQVSIRV